MIRRGTVDMVDMESGLVARMRHSAPASEHDGNQQTSDPFRSV